MPTCLVVGASRGIGLELCRQLAARGDRVIATCRAPAADELAGLGVTVIGGVDVAEAGAVAKLAHQLTDTKIDQLIHNAGILSRETLDDLDFERILAQFKVNALGPLRVVHALQDCLAPGAKIGIVSSRVGSLGDNTSGGIYGYRMSKAAVNMAGVNLALDLRARGIAVRLLHPGLVATEMTGRRGIDPAEAARGLIARMDELRLENSGEFRHAEGQTLPW